jgi:hypothetical protein
MSPVPGSASRIRSTHSRSLGRCRARYVTRRFSSIRARIDRVDAVASRCLPKGTARRAPEVARKSASHPARSSSAPPSKTSMWRVPPMGRTRKWPGMPTPSSATPARLPTSMVTTASEIGMPSLLVSTCGSSEFRGSW